MANFDTQIQDLVVASPNGSFDTTACDQWAADACKDIINKLPSHLKLKCIKSATLNNSATTLDLDDSGARGNIMHVVRVSADSGGYQKPCRLIPSAYGDLSNDSTDINYYATADDPVYWVASNSSGASTLFVKPLPTANQEAYVHYLAYPTVDVSGVDTIANFPDEAEYLVVLYCAAQQALQYANTEASNEDSEVYTMYKDMFANLMAEYQQGLTALVGGK